MNTSDGEAKLPLRQFGLFVYRTVCSKPEIVMLAENV